VLLNLKVKFFIYLSEIKKSVVVTQHFLTKLNIAEKWWQDLATRSKSKGIYIKPTTPS